VGPVSQHEFGRPSVRFSIGFIFIDWAFVLIALGAGAGRIGFMAILYCHRALVIADYAGVPKRDIGLDDQGYFAYATFQAYSAAPVA
jgi:hypothetical protein